MLGFKLGSRQKSSHPLPCHNQSSFVGLLHLKLKNSLIFYCFFGLAPYHRLSGLLERKFNVSFIVFSFNHFRGDAVSRVYFFYNISRTDELSSVNYSSSVRLEVHI